jgi:hypothetical protein
MQRPNPPPALLIVVEHLSHLAVHTSLQQHCKI